VIQLFARPISQRLGLGTFLLCLVALPLGTSGEEAPALIDATMAVDVQADFPFDPIDRTDAFPTTADRAYAWVQVGPMADTHTILWQWFFPNGRLYRDIGPTSIGEIGKRSQWWKQHGWILIQGFPPSRSPGRWRVDVILDGALLTSIPFTIREP
jgi:hypothetical protein